MSILTHKKRSMLRFLFFAFLLLSFFKLPLLSANSETIAVFYKYSQIVSFLIILFLTLKNRTISKFTLLVLLFCIILMMSTLINNADIIEGLARSMQIISISMLIEYGLKTQPKFFLTTMEIVLSTLIYINFILVLIFPEGIYESSGIGFYTTHNWLLGFKNNQTTFILPALLISFINTHFENKKANKRTIILSIVSLATLLLTNCATGAIATTFFLALIMLSNFKIKLLNNIYILLFTYIILSFSIISAGIQTEFGYFLTNLLGKDTTFTGRTSVWDFTFNEIRKKPLLGYGIENQTVRYFKDPISQTFHAHNEFLEICYKTGIIGLIVVVFLLSISAKELYKNKTTTICKIITAAFISFLVLAVAEYYDIHYLIFVLCIAYNNKYLLGKHNVA